MIPQSRVARPVSAKNASCRLGRCTCSSRTALWLSRGGEHARRDRELGDRDAREAARLIEPARVRLEHVRAVESLEPTFGQGPLGHDVRGELEAGLRDDLLRRAERDDAAVIDQHDAVAELLGLFHVMRAVEERGAAVLVASKRRDDALERLRVDADGCLVEQHDARLAEQAAREIEAALHAARVRRGGLVGPLLEPDLLDRVRGGSARGRAAQAGETGEEHRVLARRQRGVDSDLLRHAADRGAYGALFRAQIVAGDPDLAGVVRQ